MNIAVLILLQYSSKANGFNICDFVVFKHTVQLIETAESFHGVLNCLSKPLRLLGPPASLWARFTEGSLLDQSV
jgi:hypothetical protein